MPFIPLKRIGGNVLAKRLLHLLQAYPEIPCHEQNIRLPLVKGLVCFESIHVVRVAA